MSKTGAHFIDRCETHGTVMRQCRCPDPNKTVHDVLCGPGCPQYGTPPMDGEPVGPRGWAKHAIEVLNRALAEDPEAMHRLILTGVDCNEALADDPTIQCGPARQIEPHSFSPTPWGYCGLCGRPSGHFSHSEMRQIGAGTVGALGLINGIFGTNGDGKGWIAAQFGGDGQLVTFVFNEAEKQ